MTSDETTCVPSPQLRWTSVGAHKGYLHVLQQMSLIGGEEQWLNVPTVYPTWVALKHKNNKFGEWSIAPSTYFLEYGNIPDRHADLAAIKGMAETSCHTLTATDSSDGRANLINAGFTIIEYPVWYFDRPENKSNVSVPKREEESGVSATCKNLSEDTEPIDISPRLLALLKYTKGATPPELRSWRAAGKALGVLYHPEMNLSDSMHHIIAAYEEAVRDPRFQAPHRDQAFQNLITSPVTGFTGLFNFDEKKIYR